MLTNTESLRIIIADDHSITRYGLTVMLKTQNHLKIVAEASNGLELVDLARTYSPDIILTDIEMPEMNGLAATKILAKELPEIAIIALSMHDDVYTKVDMFEAGARGYLLKNADKEEALRAIETVRNNESYYCGASDVKLASLVAGGKYPINAGTDTWLTEREREVIELICKEFSSKQIAAHLNLSIRTIESHRESIMEKTSSHNIAGIVLYAVRNKIYIP